MEVFIFATGNLPSPLEHPILARRTARYIDSLPGLLGIHPEYPKGTLLIFGTRPHAEKAMAKMEKDRLPVAKHLMRGTAERGVDGSIQTVVVKEPVDGWTEEDKAEMARKQVKS